MQSKCSSCQLPLLLATCIGFSALLGKRLGIMAMLKGHPGTLHHIKSCRFDLTFANKFPVPNFSSWHRCVRNSTPVLARTFSYPSVAQQRDPSQMLCTKEGCAKGCTSWKPKCQGRRGLHGERRVLLRLPVDCISPGLFIQPHSSCP